MAYITDSTETFTITLTALLEGFGTLQYMRVWNLTQGINYDWELGIGWITTLPEAVETDSIKITAEVRNEGATTDIIFAEFISADVTPLEAPIQEKTIDVGVIWDYNWSFTMPPKNITITINAGHVE